MFLPVQPIVDWLVACFKALVANLKQYADKKRASRSLQLINTLDKPLGPDQVILIFEQVMSIGLSDDCLWAELVEGVQRQLESQTVSVFTTFITLTTSPRSPLYSSLGKMVGPVLNCESRQTKFVSLSKELILSDSIYKGPVFYVYKVLVQWLTEQHKSAQASAFLKLLHSNELFTHCDESSLKNAQHLLEQLAREAVDNKDLAYLGQVLGAVDTMLVKPQDVFFNKLLDYVAKAGIGARYSEHLLGSMIKNKVKASLVTFNTLLDLYVSQRNFDDAWYLFNTLIKNKDPLPDSYTFCTMIAAVKYMRNPEVNKASQLFKLYQESQPVDLVVANCLLDVYVSLGQSAYGQELLQSLPSLNLRADSVTFNTLIKDAARREDLAEGERLYRQMQVENVNPTRVTFNSMMDLCAKTGQFPRALEYLREMKDAGTNPDQYSYSIVFTGLKNNVSDRRVYSQTFAHLDSLLEGGFIPDEVCINSMLDVAVKFEDLTRVESLFSRLPQLGIKPSAITYGIMVKAYGKARMPREARKTFEAMLSVGLQPNEVTYGCLLEALVHSADLAGAEQLYRSLGRKGKANPFFFSTLAKGFARQGLLTQALGLWEECRAEASFKPNLVCFNVILDVACKKGNLLLACKLFEEIRTDCLFPDIISYSVIIKGHCQAKSIDQAIFLLNQMIKEGVRPDLQLFHQLLEACANPVYYKQGFEVYSILQCSQVRPTCMTFGTLAKLHGMAGRVEEAFGLVKIMQSWGIEPSLIFFTHLVHISFSNRLPMLAEKAFLQLEERSINPDILLLEKLVQGYTRARLLHKALCIALQAEVLGYSINTDILLILDQKLNSYPLKGNKARDQMAKLHVLAMRPQILGKCEIVSKNEPKKNAPRQPLHYKQSEGESKENHYSHNIQFSVAQAPEKGIIQEKPYSQSQKAGRHIEKTTFLR